MIKNKKATLISVLLAFTLLFSACGNTETPQVSSSASPTATETPALQTDTPSSEPSALSETAALSLTDIPVFSGSPYVAINNNVPSFTTSDLNTTAFEHYSNLDTLGRCGVAYANVCRETMPTEERGEIGSVKPSGWQIAKYDFVDGKYLYNRCHLIGFQLTGENANPQNLITGTRYLNVTGMLPFENMIADYVKETGNHVLYRVTPIFSGNNLVANGVQMEAESVEDSGKGILFNVYCYNNQPGVTIDYTTGNNSADSSAGTAETSVAPADSSAAVTANSGTSQAQTYIINTNTKKFHYPNCSSVGQMKESNKQSYTGSRDDLIAQGYVPCKRCNP